jgi:hypothetical protein
MQFDQLERREVITFLGGAAVTTWTLGHLEQCRFRRVIGYQCR